MTRLLKHSINLTFKNHDDKNEEDRRTRELTNKVDDNSKVGKEKTGERKELTINNSNFPRIRGEVTKDYIYTKNKNLDNQKGVTKQNDNIILQTEVLKKNN